MQTKEMDIEQALEQTDELVVKQGLKASLHSAMASSLGKAWRTFYDMLYARALLLEYAYTFRLQYDEVRTVVKLWANIIKPYIFLQCQTCLDATLREGKWPTGQFSMSALQQK
jgi:hypothetical protein